MPTYHPGKVFSMSCSPSVEVKIDAGSRGLIVIMPAFSTVAAVYSQTGTAGPTAAQTNHVTPSFILSAATAVKTGPVYTPNVAYRWAKLCSDIVCTTSLGDIGGSVYMRRNSTQTDDVPTSLNTFDTTYKSVLTDGEPYAPGALVSGMCMQSTMNTERAIQFLETPALNLTDATASVTAWRSMAYGNASPLADTSEFNWQSIMIAIDNTGGAKSLNFIMRFECVVQYLPEATSYLSTISSNIPHTGLERYVAASHAVSKTVCMRGGSSLARVTSGLTGVRSPQQGGKKGPRNKPQKAQQQKQSNGTKTTQGGAPKAPPGLSKTLANMAKQAFSVAANGAVAALPALAMGAHRRYVGPAALGNGGWRPNTGRRPIRAYDPY